MPHTSSVFLEDEIPQLPPETKIELARNTRQVRDLLKPVKKKIHSMKKSSKTLNSAAISVGFEFVDDMIGDYLRNNDSGDYNAKAAAIRLCLFQFITMVEKNIGDGKVDMIKLNAGHGKIDEKTPCYG